MPDHRVPIDGNEGKSRRSPWPSSHLIQWQDFTAAAHLLEPLCNQGDNISTASIRSSIGRIYLQSGNMRVAAKHFAAVAADPAADKAMQDMNAALLASAEGEWAQASDYLQRILQQDADNFMVDFWFMSEIGAIFLTGITQGCE